MLLVWFYLACAGLFLSLSLSGPILVALFAGETAEALRFGFYLVIGSFLSGAPLLAIRGRKRRMPQIGRLSLMFLVWTILPITAAIPIYDMTQLTFVDSLFEAFSAFTTTGSTTLNSVELWPQSMIFWRVQLQWMGGYFALLTIILVIAPLGAGGLRSLKSSLTVGADLRAGQERLLVFAINLGLLYATLTGICMLGLFFSGTRAFYAVSLAMTATSTGGFLPFDQSLDRVVGMHGQAIIALFLVIGATSIFWHRMLLRGQWQDVLKHRESYSVLVLVALIGGVFTVTSIIVTGTDGSSPVLSIVQGFLNAASLVATSGIQSQPGYFTLLPLVVILFIILVGGSAFSTSGGWKHYRLGGMLVQSWNELDRLIYPKVVSPSHFGSQNFDLGLMKAIWSFFVVSILTIVIGSVLIATTGVPFEASLTATIASFTTAGPVYNAGWGTVSSVPWPSYGEFTDSAKMTLIVIMIFGRLEIIGILGLFSLRYWRSR